MTTSVLFQFRCQAHRNLSQLPNFALSLPLAMFQLAVLGGQDTTKSSEMVKSVIILLLILYSVYM